MTREIFPGVSPADIDEWRNLECTRALVATLSDLLDDETAALVRASISDETFADRTFSRVGGKIQGLKLAKRLAEEKVR